MQIGIIGSMHGSEPLGARVLALLRSRDVSVRYIIGNPAALRRGIRYIDSDLNRSFPGRADGNREERRAYALLHMLHGVDFVIDIHTTTAETEAFIIAVEETPVVRRLIDAVPLHKVVFMPNHFAKGKSLIDHVPGVSIEFPERTDPQVVAAIIIDTLQNYERALYTKKQEFTGIAILHGSAVLANFTLIKQGTLVDGIMVTRDFYPVLSGERAYCGVCCIMAESRPPLKQSLSSHHRGDL